jgi:peptidyl-prolyl cis-trans isomerase D
MLKAMRSNLKSLAPILWAVIIAFIISIFAVWGGAGRLGESRGEDTIATIRGEKISTSYYYSALRQRIENLQREFKDIDINFIQQLNIPQQVLNEIIQQTLLLQIADDMGIKASPEEIRDKIINDPIFQREGKFIGFEQYKQLLEWNRYSISEFEESLQKNVILEKVVKILTSNVSVTEEELWESYEKDNESAKFEYLIQETDKIEMSEDLPQSELQNHYEKNKENYKIPEKREAEFVFFNTDEFKNEVEVKDSELEKYYKENQSQFEEPEKIRVSRIYLPFEEQDRELVRTSGQNLLARISQGEDFGELAKSMSKDEKADILGDWGMYEWKRLSTEEQDEIQRLSLGEVSPLMEVTDGVSILKVTEKELPIQRSLEEVRERIEGILRDQKARDEVDRSIAQLEKMAHREKSVDIAAQQLGHRILNTGPLKEGESIDDLDTAGSISTALFNLEENEISAPIYTFKGTCLAQLKRIDPPRPANFEEVQEEVKADLASEKKQEIVVEKLQKIKEDAQRTDFDTLAERYDLEYKTAEEHKRGQYLSVVGENAEIDRLAFSMPKDEISDPIKYENGYVLMHLTNRTEVTREDFEKEKETVKENLLETKRNKIFSSALSMFRNEKNVNIRYDLFLKINSDVLSRFGGES